MMLVFIAVIAASIPTVYAWEAHTEDFIINVECENNLWEHPSFAGNPGNVIMFPSPDSLHPGYSAWAAMVNADPTARGIPCNFHNRCHAKHTNQGILGNALQIPKIPQDIHKFSNLKSISLGCYTELTGTIPSSISRLNMTLEVLEISSTNLEGDFPWESITALTNLRKLVLTERCSDLYDFEGCCLTEPNTGNECLQDKKGSTECCASPQTVSTQQGHVGTLPFERSDSTVSLPPWLVSSTFVRPGAFMPKACDYLRKTDGTHHIEELYTRKRYDGTGTRSYFTGSIPESISLLSNLEHLEISDVYFSGGIPAEIGMLTKLTHLSLKFATKWDNFVQVSTGMEGQIIPPQVWLLPNLTYLAIEGDPVPHDLHRQQALALTGDLPFHFGMFDFIKVFESIHSSERVGTLASQYERWATTPISDGFSSWGLFNLRLPPAFIVGTEKTCNTQLIHYYDILERMGKAETRAGLINGNINSNSLGEPDQLSFGFYRNPFGKVSGPVGSLPDDMTNLANLSTLIIAHTHLTGSLSPLESLENLRYLRVLNNDITGDLSQLHTAGAPSKQSQVMSNTVAYNRLHGCVNSVDDSLANRGYMRTSQDGSFDMPIASQGDNYVENAANGFQITPASMLGNFYIPDGVPQRCINVNETILPICDEDGGDVFAPCTAITFPDDKLALIDLQQEFSGTALMDEVPDECFATRLFGDQASVSDVDSDRVSRRRTFRTAMSPDLIWDPETDPCMDSWPGVFCDMTGRVVALHMSGINGWNLAGPIPVALTRLVSLKHIDFSFNKLTSIPEEIGLLENLRSIDLSYNNISIIPVELINLATKNMDKSKTSIELVRYGSWKAFYHDMLTYVQETIDQNNALLVTEILLGRMGHSPWFTSIEGNPIDQEAVEAMCAPRSVNCFTLGIGDASCLAYNIETPIVNAFGLLNPNCSTLHSELKAQRAAPAVGDAWRCEICDESDDLLNAAIVFLVGVFLLIFLMILFVFFSKHLHAGVVSAVKICIAYMQIISLVVIPSVDVPAEVKPFLVGFHIFSFSFPNAELACLTGENSALNRIMSAEPSTILIFGILAYLGLIIPIGLCIKCNNFCGRLSDARQERLKKIKLVHHTRRFCCCCMSGDANARVNDEVWDAFVIKAPSLIIVPMSAAMARSFARLVPLAQDPDETFWDPSTISLVSNANGGVGIILFLNVIVLFFIALYLGTLAWFLHKADIGHIEKHRAAYLTRDFKPHLYYWIEVEILVRIGMTVVASSGIGTYLELGLALVFVAFGLSIHLYHQPYSEKAVDNFQTASFLSQFVIICLTMGWYAIEESESEGATSHELLVIAATTLALSYLFIALALFKYTYTACTTSIKNDAKVDQEVGEDGKRKNSMTGALDIVPRMGIF